MCVHPCASTRKVAKVVLHADIFALLGPGIVEPTPCLTMQKMRPKKKAGDW